MPPCISYLQIHILLDVIKGSVVEILSNMKLVGIWNKFLINQEFFFLFYLFIYFLLFIFFIFFIIFFTCHTQKIHFLLSTGS